MWTASGSDAFGLELELTERAEQLGFDAVFFGDRMLAEVGAGERGVYNSTHTELLVTLSALAARTSRIRLGSLVLVVPFRHPVQLAKMTASLDLLSKGRLILGVGSGWSDAEFAALAIDKREAAARLVEGIEVMRQLWRGEPAGYQGEFYSFDRLSVAPGPYRPEGPPIWLGSFSPGRRTIWEAPRLTAAVDRVLRRVGICADGWAPLLYSTRVARSIDPEFLGLAWQRVQEHAGNAGRAVEFVFSHWFYAIENAEDEAAARRALSWFFPGSFEQAKATYLIGSPEEIVEKAFRLVSRVDRLDWMIFTMLGPSLRQLELLHSRIVPLVRERS